LEVTDLPNAIRLIVVTSQQSESMTKTSKIDKPKIERKVNCSYDQPHNDPREAITKHRYFVKYKALNSFRDRLHDIVYGLI